MTCVKGKPGTLSLRNTRAPNFSPFFISLHDGHGNSWLSFLLAYESSTLSTSMTKAMMTETLMSLWSNRNDEEDLQAQGIFGTKIQSIFFKYFEY